MNCLKQISDYCTTNNQVNWDKIIDDYTPYINSIINKMAYDLSIEDKEEILLDAFFILWKNKNKIVYSLNSYIIGITKNLVREKFKKKRIMYNIEDYENVLPDSEYNVGIEERAEIVAIEKLFKQLKKIDLNIVNMFYYSSKSIKQIAYELNISEINVRTRLYRIRKKIKKELKVGEKSER